MKDLEWLQSVQARNRVQEEAPITPVGAESSIDWHQTAVLAHDLLGAYIETNQEKEKGTPEASAA